MSLFRRKKKGASSNTNGRAPSNQSRLNGSSNQTRNKRFDKKSISTRKKIKLNIRLKQWVGKIKNDKGFVTEGVGGNYIGTFFRDGEGPKMVLEMKKGGKPIDGKELAADIKNVMGKKKQEVFGPKESQLSQILVDGNGRSLAEITTSLNEMSREISNDSSDTVIVTVAEKVEGVADEKAYLFKVSLSLESQADRFKSNPYIVTVLWNKKADAQVAELVKIEKSILQATPAQRQGLIQSYIDKTNEIQKDLADVEDAKAVKLVHFLKKNKGLFQDELDIDLPNRGEGIYGGLPDLNEGIYDTVHVDDDDNMDLESIYDKFPDADADAEEDYGSLELLPDGETNGLNTRESDLEERTYLAPPASDDDDDLERQAWGKQKDDGDEDSVEDNDVRDDQGLDNDLLASALEKADQLEKALAVELKDVKLLEEQIKINQLEILRAEETEAAQRFANLTKPPAKEALISVAEFKKATSSGIQLTRTKGYRDMVNALDAYHGELDTTQEAAKKMQEIMAIPAGKKADLLKQKSPLNEEVRSKNKYINLSKSGLVSKSLEYAKLQNAPTPENKSARDRLVEEIKSEKQKIITLESELSKLNDEVNKINDLIESENVKLASLMNNNEKSFSEIQNSLTKKAQEIREKSLGYLDGRKKLISVGKGIAILELAGEVADPDSIKAHLKKVLSAVGGLPFNHQLAKPMKELSTNSASDVFQVQTKGNIGASTTNIGFAKVALQKGAEHNDTTIILGFRNFGKLENNPNLIARQVLSSRLDRALGIGVLADEVFSKTPDGRTIGITAKISGKQMRVDAADKQTFNKFDLTHPVTQKGLVDLQIMDAITGQLDRHLGNVLINPDTGVVKGIDNDMAFNVDSPVGKGDNVLLDQFKTVNGQLVYQQNMIAKSTAEAIIKMTPKEFEQILRGQNTDLERLDSENDDDNNAIQFALQRFTAVRNQCFKLRKENRLISTFDVDTFLEMISDGFIKDGNDFSDQSNYLARAAYRFDYAKDSDNYNQGI